MEEAPQMKHTDILVIGPMAEMQNLIQGAFHYNGYNVVWSDHRRGKAMKGSKGHYIVFGFMSQYYEFDIEILPVSPTDSTIRITKTYSGWWGGLLGASEASDEYPRLTRALCDYFYRSGRYKGQFVV